MDEMLKALNSITSLLGIKDGVESIQAIASSVGLNWAEIKDSLKDREFSFDDAQDIIKKFGDSLKIGNDRNDDQSENEEVSPEKQEILGVDFLQTALLNALGVNNECHN